MGSKIFKYFTLLIFALVLVFSTQEIVKGQSPEKQKSQEDIMRESKSYEETSRSLIEEGIKQYRGRVPTLIKDLKSTDYKKRRFAAHFLGRARDMQGIAPLTVAAINDKRAIVRVQAINSIAYIEIYNNDTTALPALRDALKDSVTDVRFHAALALASLGDKVHPLSVLVTIANGKDIEKWTVDWNGYMGLENMAEDEIKRQKKKFKDGMRKRSIYALGCIGTGDALNALREIILESPDESIKWGDKVIIVKDYVEEIIRHSEAGELNKKRISIH